MTTNNQQTEELVKFIEEKIIGESLKLISQGSHDAFFLQAALSIEFLGSFLDNKPLRARQQSKERFAASLKELFPPGYAFSNQKHLLYDKYRNHVVHTLLPSSTLWFILPNDQTTRQHLSYSGKRLIIRADSLNRDLSKAAERLIEGLRNGNYKTKWMEGI